MPMPPALAKDFEYSSDRKERHTPVPASAPNGPSPLMPVNIWLNILLRKTASKSCDAARALALMADFTEGAAFISAALAAGERASEGSGDAAGITSPRCR